MAAVLSFPFVKLFNRVLADYPLAREQLAQHAGKVIAARLGPLDVHMRVAEDGRVELIGEGGEIPPHASFQIPLYLLPRLAQRDDTAFSEVVFGGDSEFAALLSRLARDIEWDVEEDLSKFVGDIAAHRIVDAVRATHEWQRDATQRFTENVVEYLSEERRAFVTRKELETLTQANEALRDDVARLEARLGNLTATADAK